MTVLIGWIGVDSRAPCSAYLMSDSRISWGDKPGAYDYGRKLFALRNSPDILGYCGDVTFPIQVLSQICELDSSGLLFPDSSTSAERSQIVSTQIIKQYEAYPNHARSDAVIYHISRDTDLSFCAYRYIFRNSIAQWQTDILEIDTSCSSLIICDGSGKSDFKKLYSDYKTGDLSGTSRNLYQCFCDSLFHTKIPSCGGPPQLVGLYNGRKFNGIHFGIIYEHERYFCGSPYRDNYGHEAVRWYNEEFEICDGKTMEKLPGAMRQPNPNRLKRATP